MQDFLNFAAEVFEVDPSEIDETTSLNEFYKWDSLMRLKLIMEIEEKYEVDIPLDDAAKIKSLKDLYSYIQAS